MTFRLSDKARSDINAILAYSSEQHGHDGADRYSLLPTTVIEAVGNDPDTLGSRPVSGKPGISSYSIGHSRSRVPREQRVRKPVHKLADRRGSDGVVDILAVVGNSYPAARAV